MINKNENPVEWGLLMYELDDAREHIESLIKDMQQDESFDETDFDVQISHIYHHLNCAWNGRDMDAKSTVKRHNEIKKMMPRDLKFL